MIEFNQNVEFPNLFAAAMSALPDPNNDKSTTEKNYAVIRRLIEKRLLSILKQLKLFYYFDETTEKLKPDFLFDKFASKLQAVVNDWGQNNNSAQKHKLKVFVGNDVVLAILAYIYKELLDEFTKHQEKNNEDAVAWLESETRETGIAKQDIVNFLQEKPLNPEFYLRKLSMNKDEEQLPVPAQFILGIRSEASIYIELEPRNPALEELIKQQAIAMINSVPRGTSNDLPKINVSVGNNALMDFDHHGGATLNLLALDITSGDAKQYHIVQPETVEFNILSDFIDGFYRYIKGPYNPTNAQIIKAVAPLLSIPFLNIKDTVEIRNQVDRIKTSIWYAWWTWFLPGNETLELIDILKRHTFYGNAHNRAHREKDGVLSELASSGIIPIFANCSPINKERKVTGLYEDAINKILVSTPEFLTKYCDKQPNGEYKLYHGTRRFSNVLNILKQGFINSITFRQGWALGGSGVYTTNNLADMAVFSAGRKDTILALPISNNPYIRIADTTRLSGLDWLKLRIEAMQKGCFDVHHLLSEYYNIDALIFTKRYVLVLNTNIFDTRKLQADLKLKFKAEQEKNIKPKAQLPLFAGLKERQKEQAIAESVDIGAENALVHSERQLTSKL